jgi:hypothetical protein
MAKEKDIAIDDEYFDSELKSLLEGTLKGKKLFIDSAKSGTISWIVLTRMIE